MAEMSVNDINQKFVDSVVMFKKKPVYVKACNNKKEIKFLDLLSQRVETAEFDDKLFLPPAMRVGFVNLDGSVVYVSRLPMRRYSLGLTTETLRIDHLPTFYPEGRGKCVEEFRKLTRIELADALLNKYPTFRNALKLVRQFEGCVAFDKQFAVDSRMDLFYKANIVGKVRADKIVFDSNHKHLELLLDKGYEKTIPTSWD